MAATIEFLSGGTGDGRRIKVAATATPGTLIHTAHNTLKDRTFLDVNNSSTSAVNLTLEWGGTTSPDDLIHVTVPAMFSGLIQVTFGAPLSGAKVIRAFAGTTNVLTVGGHVLRG